MRLRSVELSNFRAFPEGSAPVDLDHDVVLFYGRNGVGKTAIFDAIELMLTGGIRRLSGVPDLGSVLINARKDSVDAEAKMIIGGGNGKEEGHVRINRDGCRVEPLLGSEQKAIFQHTAYLQQSEIRRLISGSSASLGDVIRTLAVSGEIEKLDRALAEASLTRKHPAYVAAINSLKEKHVAVENLRLQIRANEQALSEIEGVDATVAASANELRDIGIKLNFVDPAISEKAGSVRENVARLEAILQPKLATMIEKRSTAEGRINEATELLREQGQLASNGSSLGSNEQIEKIRADLQIANGQIDACQQELKGSQFDAVSKQRESQLAVLLEAARFFSDQDICPICDRPFADLKSHIDSKLERIHKTQSSIQAKYSDLQRQLSVGQDKRANAQQELERASRASKQFEARSGVFQQKLREFIAKHVIGSMTLEEAVVLENSRKDEATSEIDELSAIAARLSTIRSQIDAMEIRSARTTEALRRSKRQLEDALPGLRAAEQAKEELEDFLKLAQEVRKKTSEGIEEVLKSFAMGSTRENFEDLFSRLARDPLFGVTISEARVTNRRPAVSWCATYKDRQYPGEAMFSQGELNSCAMAFFLALATTNPQSLGFLLLDDPVQNMDEVRIEEFGNILKFIKDQLGWQVIVALHDESIYQYLKRQLYPCKGMQSLVGYALEMTSTGTEIVQDVNISYDPKAFLVAEVA
jgi:exonuclease SbcC